MIETYNRRNSHGHHLESAIYSASPLTNNVPQIFPVVKPIILVRLRKDPFINLGQGKRRVGKGLQGTLIPHGFQIEMQFKASTDRKATSGDGLNWAPSLADMGLSAR